MGIFVWSHVNKTWNIFMNIDKLFFYILIIYDQVHFLNTTHHWRSSRLVIWTLCFIITTAEKMHYPCHNDTKHFCLHLLKFLRVKTPSQENQNPFAPKVLDKRLHNRLKFVFFILVTRRPSKVIVILNVYFNLFSSISLKGLSNTF